MSHIATEGNFEVGLERRSMTSWKARVHSSTSPVATHTTATSSGHHSWSSRVPRPRVLAFLAGRFAVGFELGNLARFLFSDDGCRAFDHRLREGYRKFCR